MRIVTYTVTLYCMKLSDYLAKLNLSYGAFARLHGFHKQTVYHWATGNRRPRTERAQEIFRITEGLVTPNDFILHDQHECPSKQERLP